MSNKKYVQVSLTGIGGYPPKGMENYRSYRIEYGGHGRESLAEDTIFLPVNLDSDILEKLLSGDNDE